MGRRPFILMTTDAFATPLYVIRKFKKPNWKQLLGLESEYNWKYYIQCSALHPFKPDDLDGIENDPPWTGRKWLARSLN